MAASLLKLLKTPLFILKALQQQSIVRHRALLKGRVLDVGCGWRPYEGILACERYVAMEFGPLSCDVRGDAASLPFTPESFDGVLCTEVLEHVARPEAVVRELSRVLKSGGVAYISAPMCWGLHYEPYDYFRFTNHGLCLLAKQAGLQVLVVERLGGLFSTFGARLADVMAHLAMRVLPFLSATDRERVVALLVAPVSLVFFALGKLLDQIDKRDALGWVLIARKP
ncbi:MAG: class I SAM-dependent methyltransferase [Planctomycetes bacterium]|nr:class I SAM-dependent methyltransferase [Planctomycetota bacterium]MBM4078207.1 class I SAM-dependent methyltransferase [Planctomycetota bacterium]